MAKKSAFNNDYAPKKHSKRRHKKPPLHMRKKLTPSQSRMIKNGS